MASAELSDVYLLETMRVRGGVIPLLGRHLARLSSSARSLFGEEIERDGVVTEIERTLRETQGEAILRLTWRPERVSVELRPLSSTPETIALSPIQVSSQDALLAYKNTRRAAYEAAAGWALRNGVGDALLRNERDCVTESSRFCVFAQRRDGLWITPPLSDGLIDSVFRRLALETMGVQEASISLNDLEAYEGWALGNAVHGWVPVRWVNLPKA